MIKIVNLNTTVNASSAPVKLNDALVKSGIQSKILVLKKEQYDDKYLVEVKKTFLFKINRRIANIYRKIKLKKYNLKENSDCVFYPYGLDLSKNELIKEADVIILHWINGDYQSPKTIEKLIKLNKPVILFCHDNYNFTGGCHIRFGCKNFETGCGKCKYLDSENEKDPSSWLLNEKKKRTDYDNVFYFSPSKWIDSNLQKSPILNNHKHFIVPNIINTNIFRKIEKKYVRQKLGLDQDAFYVLISPKKDEKVVGNGMNYLWNTLNHLPMSINVNDKSVPISLLVFGVDAINNKTNLPLVNKGYIKNFEELAEIYSASDMMLVTSLEDSFNMTIAESMACGNPVVAFNNGGVADIIDHKSNGYLAKLGDIDDLVNGMWWIINNQNEKMRQSAIEKITNNFSEEIVIELINTILKNEIL